MHQTFQDLFHHLSETIVGYLPDLVGGTALILIGWFLGWFIKRLMIQVMVLLRVERLLVRVRWGEDFSKADIRYGFYSFIGNIGFFIVFLIFLNDALSVWRLTILSDLLGKGILFLPKLIISFVVFGLGWLISSSAAKAILRALRKEEIPRSTLIARFSKTVLLLFFSAMALAELDIAREIVIIGFATIFITLGLLTVVAAAVGGKNFLKKVGQSLEEK
jgi:Mechanosensitive ion channel, conserved TM helix